MCSRISSTATYVVEITSLQSLAFLMPQPAASMGTVEEAEVLRLRADAALCVVPLISRVVSNCADRAVIVADVVTRWLAWPDTARKHCRRSDLSGISGLESFAADYVDGVEQGADSVFDGDRPAPEEVVEQAIFKCWQQHLQQLKEDHAAAAAWIGREGTPWPNERLRRARLATPCPACGGRSMCRQALAEAVNERVRDRTGRAGSMDSGHIGKLERGLYHWPRAYYREALRWVLGVTSDLDLGFVCVRRTRLRAVPAARSDFSPVVEIHQQARSD